MDGFNFGPDKIPGNEMTDKLKQGFGNFKFEEIKRDRFFAPMVMFKNGGMNYLFSQSEKDCKVHYSRFTSKGEMILLLDSK